MQRTLSGGFLPRSSAYQLITGEYFPHQDHSNLTNFDYVFNTRIDNARIDNVVSPARWNWGPVPAFKMLSSGNYFIQFVHNY